jgi:hypothetical protein
MYTHTYSGVLAIKKNEIMLFAKKKGWISKISQPQKDKYHVFIHMENLGLKEVIVLHTCEVGTVWGSSRWEKRERGQ